MENIYFSVLVARKNSHTKKLMRRNWQKRHDRFWQNIQQYWSAPRIKLFSGSSVLQWALSPQLVAYPPPHSRHGTSRHRHGHISHGHGHGHISHGHCHAHDISHSHNHGHISQLYLYTIDVHKSFKMTTLIHINGSQYSFPGDSSVCCCSLLCRITGKNINAV